MNAHRLANLLLASVLSAAVPFASALTGQERPTIVPASTSSVENSGLHDAVAALRRSHGPKASLVSRGRKSGTDAKEGRCDHWLSSPAGCPASGLRRTSGG